MCKKFHLVHMINYQHLIYLYFENFHLYVCLIIKSDDQMFTKKSLILSTGRNTPSKYYFYIH